MEPWKIRGTLIIPNILVLCFIDQFYNEQV